MFNTSGNWARQCGWAGLWWQRRHAVSSEYQSRLSSCRSSGSETRFSLTEPRVLGLFHSLLRHSRCDFDCGWSCDDYEVARFD